MPSFAGFFVLLQSGHMSLIWKYTRANYHYQQMNDSFSCNGSSAVNGTDDREAHSKFGLQPIFDQKARKKQLQS